MSDLFPEPTPQQYTALSRRLLDILGGFADGDLPASWREVRRGLPRSQWELASTVAHRMWERGELFCMTSGGVWMLSPADDWERAAARERRPGRWMVV